MGSKGEPGIQVKDHLTSKKQQLHVDQACQLYIIVPNILTHWYCIFFKILYKLTKIESLCFENVEASEFTWWWYFHRVLVDLQDHLEHQELWWEVLSFLWVQIWQKVKISRYLCIHIFVNYFIQRILKYLECVLIWKGPPGPQGRPGPPGEPVRNISLFLFFCLFLGIPGNIVTIQLHTICTVVLFIFALLMKIVGIWYWHSTPWE